MSLHQKHHLRFILIAIITLFYFLANIQRSAIPGAIFNELQSAFSANASQITFLGAIFCWVYAFEQLLIGLMVDKLGGFRVAFIGGVVFALGAIIFPCSNSLLMLYVSRALVGFGGATFYLSAIREVKKFAKDKNFSLAVSFILFIGYSGGIFANAPFVYFVSKTSWSSCLYIIGLFTLALCVFYIIFLFIFKPVHIEKEVKFSLKPFGEILSNGKNINLYLFGSLNYGIYYVLQSVIGKKFLEDFCFLQSSTSALVLSLMAFISAIAPIVSAYISKRLNNRRDIIFRVVSILCFLSVLSICTLLFFDIRTKFIALILLIPSFIGSISPLLILSLHMINRYEVSATAVSIQNFGFFMMVGILGAVSGVLMHVFEPKNIEGIMVYSNLSYLAVFLLFLLLSVFEIFYAFKIKD